MKDAIENKNEKAIISALQTILNTDRSFGNGEFDRALKYVEDNVSGFMKPNKSETFNKNEWDEDYWVEISTSLYDGYVREKIDFLKKMSEKLYPKKEKTSPNYEGKGGGNNTDNSDSKNSKDIQYLIGLGFEIIKEGTTVIIKFGSIVINGVIEGTKIFADGIHEIIEKHKNDK